MIIQLWNSPEQSDITIGIARCKHIMSSRSGTSAYYGWRIWIVSIVPHAADQEANGTIMCEPFNVLHCNWTTFRRQWSNIPWNVIEEGGYGISLWKREVELTEQQVKINGNCLQVGTVNTPIQMLKRLRATDFIHFFIGETVAWHSEQIDAAVLWAHCNHIAN